jgi:nucleoside-diphosphate-sugar epimerase
MKIAVTGATGFIGTHVIECLLGEGHKVIASASHSDKAGQSTWMKDVIFVPYEINRDRSEKNLFEYFHKPDALIHLAWQGLPNYHSLHHIEENLMSGYFFLKNMITHGLKNVTVAGTCLEYGMMQGSLSEDMNVKPTTSYGLAKYSLYCFLEKLKGEISFSLKWPRLFYTYGRGQSPKSLLPQLDAALANGDETFKMSGGEQVRDFMPVDKLASALVKIAKQDKVTGIINCCSGVPVRLNDFIRDYLQAKKKTITLEKGFYPYPDYEPMEFWGDTTKLNSILK